MKHGWIVAAVLVSMICGGCTRKRPLSAFTVKAGMTQKDFEDLYGEAPKEIPSWMEYPLDDGNGFRIYFTAGPKGHRTVGEAGVYNPAGYCLKTTFKITSNDDTQPATLPSATEASATQP